MCCIESERSCGRRLIYACVRNVNMEYGVGGGLLVGIEIGVALLYIDECDLHCILFDRHVTLTQGRRREDP